MFKKVEYVGFDRSAELKMKAEQLTPVLASEIHRWKEDVEVRWSPNPVPSAESLNLSLSLALPKGVSESAFGAISPKDLSEDWRVRSRCRRVWSDLLGELLKKQDERVKELLFESAEV